MIKISDTKTILSKKTRTDGLIQISGTLRMYTSQNQNNSHTTAFLVSMLDEGTKSHSKDEILTKIASLGSSITFSHSMFGLNFSISTLPENLLKTISLLYEMLESPSFPTKAFSVIKKQTLERLRNMEHDTAVRAHRAFTRNIYDKKHPGYIKDLQSVKKKIKAITLDEIKKRHKEFLTNGSLCFSVSGNVQDDTTAILEKKFKKYLAKTKKSIPVEFIEKEQVGAQQEIFIPEKTSSDVYIGQAIQINIKNEDYYPLLVGVNILGKGGFSARLPRIVREEQGLTYHVHASLSSFFDTFNSALTINANFTPENTKKGIHSIQKVVKDLINNGATKEEFIHTQQSMLGNLDTYYSSTNSIASLLDNILLRERKPNFLEERKKKIQYVTLDEVNSALRKYINPDKFTVIVAGTVRDVFKK